MSSFSERLRFLRQKKGVVQRQVANALGIAISSYSLYESGQREPNLEMLEKIAKYFNVSASYLMGWEEQKTINEVLAENIKKYRNSWGVSQADVAEYVGLSPKDIEDFENGKRSPSTEILLKLSKAFNISLLELLSFPEPSDSEITEDFISNKFHENGYAIFKAHMSSKETLLIVGKEEYYEVDASVFETLISSINNYVDFSIKNMISDLKPHNYNLNPKEDN